jgi:hypothetical protein
MLFSGAFLGFPVSGPGHQILEPLDGPAEAGSLEGCILARAPCFPDCLWASSGIHRDPISLLFRLGSVIRADPHLIEELCQIGGREGFRIFERIGDTVFKRLFGH